MSPLSTGIGRLVLFDRRKGGVGVSINHRSRFVGGGSHVLSGSLTTFGEPVQGMCEG
jgi:hypothetical protein